MNFSFSLAKVVALIALARAWLTSAVELQYRRARKEHPISADSTIRRAAQAQTVITVVVIGVVAMVGILIFSQVESALPAMSTNESNESYSPLAGSLDSVTEGFGSSIEFVPIIMLVLLASVVIMVVQRMRT